ncbi:MAG: polysaccharide deacetylase family protein [Wolinella sp.]
MIVVKVPTGFFPERRYIIQTLLGDFLGFDVEILEHHESFYELSFGGDSLYGSIRMRDVLFSRNDSYLMEDSLPCEIEYYEGIPVIYGEGRIDYGEIVDCAIDIFGSSFFMLSRFEERIESRLDEFGRFPEERALSVRFGFFDMPIVNYYLKLLLTMFEWAKFPCVARERKYNLLLTHDIDSLFFWNFGVFCRRVRKALFGYGNYKQALREFSDYFMVWLGLAKDPFDKFDYFMRLAERFDTKAHFFFMSGGNSEFDNFYSIRDKKVKKILQKITLAKHVVGIHPSYNSFDDIEMLKSERESLERVFGGAIICGRQHYLRFSVPLTWRLWDSLGFEWDSTVGFAERVGFRCGVCYPFRVFDVEKRETLGLVERPLILMDCAFDRCSKSAMEQNKKVISECKKFQGECVVLWHNSSFAYYDWAGFDDLYEQILALAAP